MKTFILQFVNRDDKIIEIEVKGRNMFHAINIAKANNTTKGCYFSGGYEKDAV